MSRILQKVIRKARRLVRNKLMAFRSPLKVGVIGFGAIAPAHVFAYEECGLAKVVGVADPNPRALATALDQWPSLRAYRDYRQMLAELKPDIVSVCTWPQLHAAVVAAAVTHGVKG